tara:strand:- start:4624 stop:5754 length:1131 start_codon:yes stop_codon:yes gene_type:complete
MPYPKFSLNIFKELRPMFFHRLEIHNFRNINRASLNCHPRFNIIIGENGSGKTSLLEAIHLLALGRSFRSHLKSRIINHESTSLAVFAELTDKEGRHIPAGIEKSVSEDTKLRLNGETPESIAELARLLPIQLLNPDSYELIDSGPKYRRQFLDWGVFHVEPRFIDVWNKAQRLLKQRNAAIRQQYSQNDILVWDQELVSIAEDLDMMRQAYFELFEPLFHEVCRQIVPIEGIKLQYYSGWDKKLGLLDQLQHRIDRDIALGYTHNGPHRADLRLKLDAVPVQDVLSRGQQKLLVCALRIAQAKLYEAQANVPCIFLIDDLPSELDQHRRGVLLEMLLQMSGQFFITGVDEDQLASLLGDDAQLINIEAGELEVIK